MNKFNSRETYLAYRSNWKAQYKELSAAIRLFRLAYNNSQRRERTPAQERLMQDAKRRLHPANGLCFPTSFFYQRLRLGRQATAMLEELKEAKLEAQRQYLAGKAAVSLP